MIVSNFQRLKSELSAKLLIWLAAHASKNSTWLDRLCRKFVAWVMRADPQNDFMRDPIIDNDMGFDPDELDRYQRGELD